MTRTRTTGRTERGFMNVVTKDREEYYRDWKKKTIFSWFCGYSKIEHILRSNVFNMTA